MVEQQAPNPANINLRSKGLTIASGKLHKGCVKDATSKLSIGSIPATYQSIIYRTESKKAFGTSAKRFYKIDEAERMFSIEKEGKQNKSPLSSKFYEEQLTVVSENTYGLVQGSREGMRKDFNKEGHGAFVSKVKRQWIKSSKAPGPTHYHVSSQKKENDKNQVEGRKCKTRLLKNRKKCVLTADKKCRDKNVEESPGPGEYLYDRKQFWNSSLKGWRSSFQTKVSRDGYLPDSISPGPGFYINEEKEQQQNHAKKQLIIKEQQNKVNMKYKSNIFNQIEEFNTNDNQPGPGWYNQQLPDFKPLYERIKMSKNFISPVFTGKKRIRPSPGPNQYLVKRIYDDMKPKLIESMAFMSETKRQTFQPSEIYGPNLVPPELPGPKKFHFNINDQWL